MAIDVRAGLTRSEGRRFALTLGAAFLAIAGVLTWRDHAGPALTLGAAGALLGVAGLLAPGRLGPLYRAWMGLALVLSRITTPIFMAVVYFVVLTPFGILRRTLGKNPMVHEPDDGSFWRPRTRPSSDLTRQF